MTRLPSPSALRTIGWSQRELARGIGVDETRVRRWTAGRPDTDAAGFGGLARQGCGLAHEAPAADQRSQAAPWGP
jgi:ribosome-binding protein aMBF1 (putative translation factor)